MAALGTFARPRCAVGAAVTWSRPGETIALDNVTLYLRAAQTGWPTGPDREAAGNTYVPEEWKSSKRVSRTGTVYQLGTYFILIEEEYGVRPAFGVVVLGDGSRVEVPNTDALRREVLSITEQIRDCRAPT